jgi:signal transduction histidine kinase
MMENLINDLLDLGNIENSAFKLQEEYFSLPEVILEAFEIVNSTATKNQIKL